MAGPPHHYMANLSNAQPNPMRNPFVQNPMQNQIGAGMPMQMGNPMGGQLGQGMMSPMSSSLNSQMNPGMTGNNPMLGQLNQQYNLNTGNQMNQMAQPPNSLQMGSSGMEFSNMHAVQQPQQSTMQPNPGVTPTPPVQTTQQQQQSKEFNTASLCRIGQETVQDIVSRTQEVFQTLKAIQPPNGTPTSSNASNEKKAKVQEQLRTIRVLFKRLRLIYEKCNENCQIQGMEYTHIESLIPFKDEMDPKHDEKKNTEAYRQACLESKEVMEQVVLKNKQLKEVIDQLRRIIWEINTMLTMRRS
ncbi:hypothetical protein WA026_008675 [Henosepilachna vigintioctopunctata]|uniref:Mediator of RNA polymerase II transcription subunit 30 n=1 Tax=Henosepilachna vigintioctopunctata TaxID=420089 RepID=A0AAW1V8Y2_9CUCU